MSGFFVHRDSRTEALARELFDALESERPRHVLAAQTIVVAHPGLGRWLLGEFARRGPRGIAANFDLIQPWQWLERAAERALGDKSDAAFRQENLRWHIHALLPALDDARVRGLLDGGDGERRRFQLADRLAGVYAQYLTYRPDWIAAWESGAKVHDWQGTLWQRVRRRIAGPHRAQRRAQLVRVLSARGDGVPEPLHVFGVSHLPADVLAALRAVSTHRAVHLYFPDPCREYWADLKSKRQMLRLGVVPDDWYFQIGHPLLVSQGRMAQDFFIALENAGIELDAGADATRTQAADLLARLQDSIRAGVPALAATVSATPTDASLRVHSCSTRLRELEVLKDALLGFLADDAALQHRDIVVMAPDISAYAPYLPAVFGEAAHYSSDPAQIPWHLADVRLAQTHPLPRAFAKLLDLGESRFALSEVLDLFDVPALARRFGLDGADRDALESTLRRAGVAWGLDASMKAQAGAAAVESNSWSFGFDRIFAGAIAGTETDGQLLDGVLPLPGIDVSVALVLGRVHRLIEALRELRDGFAQQRGLRDWCDWLGERVDALFRADVDDAAESRALDALRRALAELGEQASAAAAQKLPWSVVREALRGQLDAVSERQPFLLGGVTFCGLVPQRSIPFRVVCLLGMNDGEFPRAGVDAGLNRMPEKPRCGDRDTRREDRQLFLEALLAARQHLHISYIGRDVQEGRRMEPAAPLAELLQFLDEACVPGAGDARPWRIEHPLQPFAARYFDKSDTRLFSFNGEFAERNDTRLESAVFVDLENPAQPARDETRIWTLDGLTRFWRDPLKAQLHDIAGIDRDALDDDAVIDSEPLKSNFDRRERMETRVVFDALRRGEARLPEALPEELARSGLLAGGAIGAQAWTDLRARAQPVLAELRQQLGVDARQIPRRVDVDIGGIRIAGIVRDVYACAQDKFMLVGLRMKREADFGDLLPFYIRCAALRSADPGIEPVFLEQAESKPLCEPALLDAIRAQDEMQLRDGVQALLSLAQQSLRAPLLFPAKTAWAWCTAKSDARFDKARKAWRDDEGGRGESTYAPGYAALFARGMEFLDGISPAARRFSETCARVAAVLDPQRTVLLRETEPAPR
ncbi:MAG: exodeoxyribonuclease V subunit gamma [Xanthomonadaceae bacterium]|nr:exodeoxyribonuclease V subunit gamma [Xanthomonadaceae bacterium]